MSRKTSNSYRARRLDRERRRRQAAAEPQPPACDAPAAASNGRARRAAASDCGWCGGPITPGSRGPIPKWCSAACRHRAWEQTRAAASGRSAVDVVERRVQVRIPRVPRRHDWAALLHELAAQLDDGRVYDRDLPQLARALEPVLEACRRRTRAIGARDPR